MKKIVFAFLPLLLLGGCQKEEYREVKQYTIEQFMDNQDVAGSGFSHDESRVLLTNNKTGIYNAYELSLDGKEPKALTNSTKNSVFAVSYFPNDNRFLYSSDEGGNELNHLYLQDTTGKATDLTAGKAKAQFYGWAHDKKSFFFIWNKRDARFFDLYEMDVASLAPKLIFQNDGGYSVGSVSNDKKYISLSKEINTNDSELFLYELATKKMTKISENLAAYQPTDFSVDSQKMYYLTDDGAEFKRLMSYDIAKGKREKVVEEKWDIMYAYHSDKGRYRVIGINDDARTVVKVFDMQEGGKEVDFPKFEDGNVNSVTISDSEQKVAISVGSSTSNDNLYVYDFKSKDLKKLTDVMSKAIEPTDLVQAEVVRFKSFDGTEIPAILYRPHQASAGQKVPALVKVHGGPGGQARTGYSDNTQFLVNHGYAVLDVNNRGSSGYGKTFYKMDDKNHGEKDLQDCIEGKNYLASLDWVDKEKIGIMGGSYGGFMVMAALTSKPKEFKVGVNYFGVVNWLRTLKSIPPWWESFKAALYQEMGDPNTADSLRLRRISPLFNANNIEIPLIVLQGSQDPRVLQVESDEMVAAAKKKGVPVEYVLFPDEGHGFVKKENQIKASKEVLAFLDKYLSQKKTD